MSMYCCYRDCPNQHKTFSNKSFFNLPVDLRREVWIKNSGNENEGIDWNRRKMFCEDHFDPKYFRRQFNRTTLRRDAVPYVYSADPQEVEFIEMAESEEDEDSTQLKYIEFEQNSPNADNDNQDSFVIVVDNNTQRAMRLQNKIPEIPKNSARPRVEKHSQQSNPNQKTYDVDFELVIPKRREASKRVVSVLEEPGLRFIATKRPHEGDGTVEKQIVIKKTSPSIVVNQETTNKITPSAQPVASNADLMVSSTEKTDSNNEETYFALSLVSSLKRLSPHKRAIAKCHILSYLTELEYGRSEPPN